MPFHVMYEQAKATHPQVICTTCLPTFLSYGWSEEAESSFPCADISWFHICNGDQVGSSALISFS